MFKNWKTSLFGLSAGLLQLFATGYHPNFKQLGGAILTAALGAVAKDADVTGGTRPQDGGTVAEDSGARNVSAMGQLNR